MTKKLSLEQVGKNEWIFSYPKIYDKAQDIFIDGLEEFESGSI